MNRRRRSPTLFHVKTVTCSCGRVITGESGDELLAAVERHIDIEHRPANGCPEPTTATSQNTIAEVEQ